MQSNKHKPFSTVQAVVKASKPFLNVDSTKYAAAYKARFRKELLPSPKTYYPTSVEKFTLSNSDQAISICPFHDDRRPSFSMDLKTGAFNCFACGRCGGDIIDFYMLIHGVGFVTACRNLEVWYE
jgi:hypothetical protein